MLTRLFCTVMARVSIVRDALVTATVCDMTDDDEFVPLYMPALLVL